jgi:hypothetical protein
MLAPKKDIVAIQYTAINPYTIDNIRGALLTAVPFFDDVCGQKNIDNAEYLVP